MNFYEDIKVQEGLARSQMRRLQRHRISEGETTGPTGRNIYAAPREKCAGKGRVASPPTR